MQQFDLSLVDCVYLRQSRVELEGLGRPQCVGDFKVLGCLSC